METGMNKVSELFADLDISLKYGCGRYRNRNVRFLEPEGLFQIGEPDEDFDRWGNSVEVEFDLYTKVGRRQLIRFALESS
jgi:hypothetical protein